MHELCNRRRSLNRRREDGMCCIWMYECDFCWFHGPSGSPPPVPPKASCWLWGLFVFAFCNEMPSGSIGCAEPALLSLWYASWIWQHLLCMFSPHWIEADSPSAYSDAQQPPIGPALPSAPPLSQGVDPYWWGRLVCVSYICLWYCGALEQEGGL